MVTPRWEDFEYSFKKNESGVEDSPFSYLGMGWVPEMFDPTLDDSPHTGVDKVDPIWAEITGIKLDTNNTSTEVESVNGGKNEADETDETRILEKNGWNKNTREHIQAIIEVGQVQA
jgi:hypothetical protein